MDFSSEFVAFRDRLAEGQDKAFVSHQNVPVAGRIAALFSSFGMDAERKLLGLVALGGSTHAHEYRILFAVPELDEQALADWWEYAVAAERELVKPDKTHEFSLVSVIRPRGEEKAQTARGRPRLQRAGQGLVRGAHGGGRAGWAPPAYQPHGGFTQEHSQAFFVKKHLKKRMIYDKVSCTQ